MPDSPTLVARLGDFYAFQKGWQKTLPLFLVLTFVLVPR